MQLSALLVEINYNQKINIMKIAKIYPRDIIALVVLVFSLSLIAMGINAIVSGIVIMIVTYYFSKRTYEEGHPKENIHEKVKEILEAVDKKPMIKPTAHLPIKVNSAPQNNSYSGTIN